MSKQLAIGSASAPVLLFAVAAVVACTPPVSLPEGDCGGLACDAHASCHETGTPRCVCEPGWTGDGVHCADEDECANGAAACDANATCHNTPGGYECACAPGFEGDGTSCTDLDECTGDGADACGPHGTCENVPGDFTCLCDEGWTASGHACVDADECATGAISCGEHEACVNLPGSFACACAAGWTRSGEACIDVDECAGAVGPCDPHASCTNTEGAFTCACASGFTGDGRTCADVDECASATSPCPGTTCENTPGGYRCRCPAGQAWNVASRACEDADECALGLATCGSHETCVNLPGSYRCDCAAGWLRQGIVCVDVDECAAGAVCPANASCANLPGSYRCACDPGFAEVNGACVDVDECAGGNPCGSLGTCENTSGSYRCHCSAGAIRDAGTCRPAFPGHLAATWVTGCDVRVDGSLWCWGSGESAALGANRSHTVPEQVPAPAAWSTVSMGTYGASAGIASDGTLWQWGPGKGLGGTAGFTPVRVSADTDWLAAAASDDASCALKRDGSLWCWGPNRTGLVGDGTLTARPAPVRIGSGNDWTRVSIGQGIACAIHSGAISCWGSGIFGNGQYSNSSVVPVAGPAGSDWVEVNVGYANCGIRTDGSLWCWGRPIPYSPSRGSVLTPERMGTETGWTQVASSVYQASVCALRGGAIWCVGANQLGQLGVGDNVARATLTQVAGPADYTELASGGVFACGRHESGAVSCWGQTLSGRLGNGLGLPRPPTRVGTDTWKMIRGANYTMCGLRSDNVLACAGQYGDAAHGTHAQVPTPVGSWTDWTDFTVGSLHMCGLHADGKLTCWGNDDYGQCGAPTPVGLGFLNPTQVGATTDAWTSVSAGSQHTCGIKADGSGWCWGSNAYGQLGRTLQGSSSTPLRVGTGTWRSLSAGQFATCGVDGSGALWCWGSNMTWQLGTSLTTSSSTPVRVGFDTDWYQVAVDFTQACALKTSGALWCWGSRGTTPYSGAEVPVHIGTDLYTSIFSSFFGFGAVRTDGRTCGGAPPNIVPFETGMPIPMPATYPVLFSSDNCGLQSDGSLWCMGNDEFGQLGFGTAWSTVPVAQITGQ